MFVKWRKNNVCNKINRVSLFQYNKGTNASTFGFKFSEDTYVDVYDRVNNKKKIFIIQFVFWNSYSAYVLVISSCQMILSRRSFICLFEYISTYYSIIITIIVYPRKPFFLLWRRDGQQTVPHTYCTWTFRHNVYLLK